MRNKQLVPVSPPNNLTLSTDTLFKTSSCCFGCELKLTLVNLRQKSNYWQSQHKRAVEREAHLREENEALRGRIRYLEKQLYGKKSEKHTKSESSKQSVEAKRNRGHQHGAEGHGRRDYSHLPAIEETIVLPAGQCACSQCGLPFDLFPGTEDSEEVVVEVQAHRRIYHRKRYKATCTCPGNPGIITAPLPPRLIPGSKIHYLSWVHILIEKYYYQRPLNRVLDSMEDVGAGFAAGTICDGMKRLAPLFDPICEAIHEKSLTEKWWHADETRWMVVEMLEGKKNNRWWVWVFLSQSTVVYILADTRGSSVVEDFFEAIEKGILIVDRHSSYKCFVKTKSGFILVFCWAHVRRDFLDVVKKFPELESWGHKWVKRIGELYHINNQRITHSVDTPEFLHEETRLRQALADMEQQRDKELNDENLHSACKKVLESLRNHWPGLTVFVDKPHIPMDNNNAERALRNGVCGRKNYYGSGSIASGHLTMTLFTIFQTLCLWKVNLRTWLAAYLQACAENKGQSPADISEFLPWNMSEEKLAQYRTIPLPTITADSS